MRSAIVIAAVLVSAAAPGGEEPPKPRGIEAVAGESVVVEAPGPVGPGAQWVQLSGPDLLFRGGVAAGGHVEFRAPTPGRYRLAHLPDGAPAVGEPFVVTVDVALPHLARRDAV